jgi:predicted hydrocarbon binding protein
MTEHNEILNNITFDPEKGAIHFKGVRYLIIRPETIMEMFTNLYNTVGETAVEAFYQGGFTGGKLSSTRFKNDMGFDDRQIIDFMANMGTQIGWGNFDVVEFDPENQKLIVEVQSSPFAEAASPSSKPVCHFIRGVLAGMCTGLFRKEVESVEETCLATGAQSCRFVISV